MIEWRTEKRKVSELKDWPDNPRRFTDKGMKDLEASMTRPIENNSSPGQAVYEPFSGSGTTIIAGEMTGRSVLAMELNPAYVDMAVIRWMQFTGKDAIHADTGTTFNTHAQVLAEAQTAA